MFITWIMTLTFHLMSDMTGLTITRAMVTMTILVMVTTTLVTATIMDMGKCFFSFCNTFLDFDFSRKPSKKKCHDCKKDGGFQTPGFLLALLATTLYLATLASGLLARRKRRKRRRKRSVDPEPMQVSHILSAIASGETVASTLTF